MFFHKKIPSKRQTREENSNEKSEKLFINLEFLFHIFIALEISSKYVFLSHTHSYALLCKPQSMRSGKVENLCRIFIIIMLILKTFQWNAVCGTKRERESMTTSTTLHAISQWLINIRVRHDKGDDDQKKYTTHIKYS